MDGFHSLGSFFRSKQVAIKVGGRKGLPIEGRIDEPLFICDGSRNRLNVREFKFKMVRMWRGGLLDEGSF